MPRLLPLRGPITPVTAPGERIYAIGDIHGRLDLFREILRQFEEDCHRREDVRCRLVILGDVIDRGPHSRRLLERIFTIQRRSDDLIMLLGNHEDMLLASADGSAGAQRLWLSQGGAATLSSYGLDPAEWSDAAPAERGHALSGAVGTDMLEWLRSRPAVYRSGDYLFCHAGIRPGVPLARQKRDDLLWIRGKFLDSAEWHGAMIVHGHSEVDRVSIEPNRINLDTAAYRTGRLSGLGLEGRSRWVFSAHAPVPRANSDPRLAAGPA